MVLYNVAFRQKLVSDSGFYPSLCLQPKLGLKELGVRVRILRQVMGLGEFHNGLIDVKIAGLLYASAPGSEIKYNRMNWELV